MKNELEMFQKLIDTTCILCDWIQAELESVSSDQTESILPEMLDVTGRFAKNVHDILHM